MGYFRTLLRSSVLVALGCTVLSVFAAALPTERGRISETYGKWAVAFEANQGQADSKVKYLARGQGYCLFLTSREAVLNFSPGSGPVRSRRASNALRMSFVGSNPAPKLEGSGEAPGVSNYLVGDNPGRWITGIRSFSRVRYRDLYPGIDLLFYGTPGQLEFDLVVAPAADPSRIVLSFRGTRRIRTEDGDLVLDVGIGELRQLSPRIFQERDGARKQISGRYRVLPDGRVTIDVAGYDRSKPLVIDPVIKYSALLGGSAVDYPSAVAVDSTGSVYVTGRTSSSDFPTSAGSLRSSVGSGTQKVFVAKLAPDGKSLIYCTYFGGSGDDAAVGIAVDSSGNAFIAGNTASWDFPVTAGAYRSSGRGVFVTKLNSSGTALLYSTLIAGPSGATVATAMAADASGNVYVAGSTFADDFPCTAGALQSTKRSNNDAFIAKLNSFGSGLAYATFLGGSSTDYAVGLSVDDSGNAYVAGITYSPDFPTTAGALKSAFGGDHDTFVSKLNPAGTALVYSTFLGGSQADEGSAIAVDHAGYAYVAGRTWSSDFPVSPNAFLGSLRCCGSAAFVSKLHPDGSALDYSTYFGPLGTLRSDISVRLALDSAGTAYIAGATAVPILTTNDAVQHLPIGLPDSFVVALGPYGDTLTYSTYVGGNGPDNVTGIAVDQSNAVYVTGSTSSTSFPVTSGAFRAPKYGAGDAFVVKLQMDDACVGSVSAAQQNFGAGGGSGSIGITASGTCSWIAYASASWLTVTQGGSGTGDGAVQFTVARNSGTAPRDATIQAAGQTVAVHQTAGGCAYTVSPASRSLGSGGGMSSFEVDTADGCAWSAVSQSAWISLSAPTSGTGSGIIFFRGTANVDTSRTGTISMAGQVVTVTQSAPCSYALSAQSQAFGAAQQNGTVTVTTGAGCDWQSISNATWITVIGDATVAGSGTTTYSVSANLSPVPRTATLTVAGLPFTVTQAAGSRASGDYDGNGKPDVVWFNPSTSQVKVSYYSGSQGTTLLGSSAMLTGSFGWTVVAAADFDGNGKPDLVWFNRSTGQVQVHYYGGAQGNVFQGVALLLTGSLGWDVVAAADFDGDGKPDLVWLNRTSGQVQVHYYGGSQGNVFLGGASLVSGSPGWTISGAADFDGNGTPDLIWFNSTTGQVQVSYYGGAQGRVFQRAAALLSGSLGWTVMGANDFDGNGTPDLVWLNEATRQVQVHYYGGSGGSTFLGGTRLDPIGNPGWRPVVPK
jgi:hypothetical protein